jgi:hypothetical protein
MGQPTEAQSKMLADMRKRQQMGSSAYSESRQDELDDLRFLAGSPDNRWQWPNDVLGARGAVASASGIVARPCLTNNRLPQHVKQVTNDQRQNRPAGKVIPADDKADIEVAEIFDGIVRHIEYMSDADVAYDTACENQVSVGEGYIRLLTEYCDEDSFDQDIRIARVRNPFSVVMDPTIQDPCGADAEWCIISEMVSKDEYERRWPNAMLVSSIQTQGVGDNTLGDWLTDNSVRIAEYFYKKHDEAELLMFGAGISYFADDPQAKELQAAGLKHVKKRTVDRVKVMWCKTNGYETLEEQEWAGKWIPVVRVVGNEFEIEGKLYLSGIVRNAKDAQRMINYWTSQEAEMLALAPKAPFIGYSGQFEGFEQQWKTANTTNWPYLEVNSEVFDGNGAPLPLPQRSMPPMASSGLLQAKAGAYDDLKAVTGQYDASLGMQGNEKSGKAILARERQSDTGTYHYVDNLARAVRFVTRQIVDLAPKIMDTRRIARIIGIDGDPSMITIDPDQAETVKKIRDEKGIVIEKIYNLSVGKYDVCVTTGPSYMTKRQEAMEAMAQLLQGNPQLWAVAGDLFIKNMDWPGAQEMSKRFAKTIDPKLMEDNDEDPALAAAQQQMQTMAEQMQQMQQMLQQVEQSFEAQDLKIREYSAQAKAATDEYKAETDRLKVTQPIMSMDQIQDIVLGTVHGMMTSGDLVGSMPTREEVSMGDQVMGQPEMSQQAMPPVMEGVMP